MEVGGGDNPQKKLPRGHEVENMRFDFLDKIIKFQKLIDTIRRVRHSLLSGSIYPENYNEGLVNRVRNIGSQLAALQNYIGLLGSYPWFDRLLLRSVPIDITIMDGLSLGLGQTTNIVEAEDALLDLDEWSSELENSISSLDPSVEFSDDTDSNAIDSALTDMNDSIE